MKHPRLGILGGLAALTFGLGVAAAGVGHLLQSVPSARAADGLGPTITGGVHPWVNLTGVLSDVSVDTVIYTVPPDRILVLTGGCVDNTFADLYQDGILKMDGSTELLRCDNTNSTSDNNPSLLRMGNAHIVFEPGSQVIVNVPGAAQWPYYLEGHLARP
ncbi:MAG: hypothetical protein AAGF11_38420 [Myxococcota bacterium]